MIFHDPQFWTLVSFSVFAGVAARPLWGQAKKTLDARIHKIEANLHHLESVLKETTATFQSEKRRSRSIQKEIKSLLSNAHQEVLRLKATLEADLERDLQDLEKITLKRFEEKKERTINQVKERAIKISKDTALQVLKDALSPAVQEKLINNQIKFLREKTPRG